MRPDRPLMFWRQLAAMRAAPFAAVPDAELLARFTAGSDEAAFEELARRHGGMVWAVCRQLLSDPADAEDAFQAVFLAFVQSSGRVRGGNVGAWLHGTAVRGAMKLRRGAVRARQRDRATAKPEAATPPGDWNELLAAVHDEVGRLPEALRTAFVVCDLEGVPQPDAATRLGWKAGTLTGRLSKARKRLLDALTKRGLAPAATLGLLGLSAATTSADVPLKLLVTVLNFPSAAQGTVPVALAALSLEIVPMALSKVKLLALAAMLTCGLAAGTGTVLVRVADAQAPGAGRPGGAPSAETPKPSPVPKPVPEDAPTAKQLLERMSKTYADCKTYRDSGVVTTLFVQDTGNRTVEKPFKTAFVRPDQFRFEYKDDASRYIIWSKGKALQTWWDVEPGIEKPASMQLAVAGATGVSAGSASRIPGLLMPDQLGGWGGIHVSGAKRIDDGKLEKVECFRVEGKYVKKPITLWIDKKSYLVRRVDGQTKFDNFRTEETTTYDPVVDGEITDKMLEFDPPKQK